MKVAEAMSRPPLSCGANTLLDVVMRTMWERDLGALPVVNEQGQPIAMITDRDVAVAAYTQGRALRDIQVLTAMSRQVYTAHVSDGLSAAERTMRVHQVRRLPVVDESTRLVGVVTLSDIARLRVQPRAAEAQEHQLREVAVTLAAIVRHPGAEASAGSEPGETWSRSKLQRGVFSREAPHGQDPLHQVHARSYAMHGSLR